MANNVDCLPNHHFCHLYLPREPQYWSVGLMIFTGPSLAPVGESGLSQGNPGNSFFLAMFDLDMGMKCNFAYEMGGQIWETFG